MTNSPSPDPGRAALAEALRAEFDAVTRRGVARICEDVVEYRTASREIIDQLGRNVRRHLEVYVALLEGGVDPASDVQVDFVLEATRQRVEQGVSSESLVRSFSSATLALWSWMVDEAWVSPGRAEVLAGAWPVWLAYINEASARVSSVYRDVELQRLEDESTARAEALDALLRQQVTGPLARRVLSRVGFDPDRRTALVLLRRTETTDDHQPDQVRGLLREAASRLESLCGSRPLATTRDGDVVVLAALGTAKPAAVRDALVNVVSGGVPASTCAVVSDELGGVEDVADAWTAARRAADVVAGHGTAVLVTDLSVLDYATHALGSDIRFVCPARIRAFVLEPARDHDDWLETANEWVRQGLNVKQTAAALHVHVNTIYYRLAQIAKSADVDPHDLEQVIGLVVAGRLRHHLRPSAGL